MSESRIQTKIQISAVNRKLFSMLLLLIVISIAVQVLATSRVGTKSAEIDSIRKEKDNVRLEAELLKSKINEEKTIASIKEDIATFELQDKVVERLDGENVSGIAYSNN